ncbi:heterokaryon incompatibility protein-domain-containing protein [Biscogniauxia sp. FL1348]|nr:heterokaryon incompatibility protein-domain-containing protein [Biscogniauxia sp. FL1348]
MSSLSTRDLDECSFCGLSRKPNPRLCNECQIWNIEEHVFTCKNQVDVDLDALSYVKPPEPLLGKTVPGADRFEDLKYLPIEAYGMRQGCMLCREVYHETSKKKIRTDEGIDVRISPMRPFTAGKLWFSPENRGTSQKQGPYKIECVLPVVLEKKPSAASVQKSPNIGIVYSTITLELILLYEKDGQTLLDVTLWDRSFFDTKLIEQWLSDCQETHDYDCNETVAPMSLPKGFRLIDTINRCVVIPPDAEHFDFVTLSYVWSSASGGNDIQLQLETLDPLSRPGSLSAREIPTLIDDAIVLCSSLGQRYLWVDRLCIIQDDAISKHDQIHAMDAIYHLAVFTIVALTNGIDAIGLPGSPNRPRDLSKAYNEWQFGREGKGYCAFPSMGLVDQSGWNTRGWTFQERLLSGRHLFISAQQILVCCGKYSLNCNSSLTAEEISLGLDQGNRQDLERGVRQIRYYRKYRTIVVEYSRKKLSFGSDILNAFTGITHIVGSILETDFLFGLPERFFLESLLWGPSGLSKRRKDVHDIPSWSWAAWDGIVDYRPIQTFDPAGQQVGNLVAFYSVNKQGGLQRLKSNYHWFFESFDGPPSERPPGRSFAMRDWKEAMSIYSHRPGSLEVWEQCPHNPSETLKRLEISADIEEIARHLPGHLVFNTTKAILELKEPPDGGTHRVPLKNRAAGQEFLLICDKNSSVIGITMWMGKEWRKENISLDSTHEFIVIGAGVQKYAKYDVWPYGSTNCPWGLYVMLIKRRSHVCQRIAIGAVQVNAWHSVDPQWETIILG